MWYNTNKPVLGRPPNTTNPTECYTFEYTSVCECVGRKSGYLKLRGSGWRGAVSVIANCTVAIIFVCVLVVVTGGVCVCVS